MYVMRIFTQDEVFFFFLFLKSISIYLTDLAYGELF